MASIYDHNYDVSMSIKLELRKFFLILVLHIYQLIERDIKTKFPYFLFWTCMSKISHLEICSSSLWACLHHMVILRSRKKPCRGIPLCIPSKHETLDQCWFSVDNTRATFSVNVPCHSIKEYRKIYSLVQLNIIFCYKQRTFFEGLGL